MGYCLELIGKMTTDKKLTNELDNVNWINFLNLQNDGHTLAFPEGGCKYHLGDNYNLHILSLENFIDKIATPKGIITNGEFGWIREDENDYGIITILNNKITITQKEECDFNNPIILKLLRKNPLMFECIPLEQRTLEMCLCYAGRSSYMIIEEQIPKKFFPEGYEQCNYYEDKYTIRNHLLGLASTQYLLEHLNLLEKESIKAKDKRNNMCGEIAIYRLDLRELRKLINTLVDILKSRKDDSIAQLGILL